MIIILRFFGINFRNAFLSRYLVNLSIQIVYNYYVSICVLLLNCPARKLFFRVGTDHDNIYENKITIVKTKLILYYITICHIINTSTSYTVRITDDKMYYAIKIFLM